MYQKTYSLILNFAAKLASPIEALSTVVSIAISAAVPPYNKLYICMNGIVEIQMISITISAIVNLCL